MKKLILLIVFAIAIMNVFGADRYWVGGASNSWANINSWATSTGGTPGASVPVVGTTTSGDNVYFDANSGGTVAVALGSTLGSGTTALNNVNFTSSNVTFSGAYALYANNMTLTNSPITFNADAVIVNSSFTFSGASSKITHNPATAGKAFILGNGFAFTLTGNNATNCFDGNDKAQYNINTTTAFTAYFNPNNVYYQLIINKGIITLGTDFQTNRLSWGSAPSANTGLTLNGKVLTLSSVAPGSCTLTANNAFTIGIDANIAGSKVVISTTQTSFLNATGRIFKDATNIDNLEMNSTGTFIPGYPLTVKNLILNSGNINNSSNNITIASGGSVTRTAGTLQAPPVFTGAVNVTIGAATATAGCELLGSTGRVGTLTVNNSSTYTLNASTGITATPITSGGLGYATVPTATFSAPTSGTTATGTAVIANGAVVGVNLTSTGTGYTTAPTITIAAPVTPSWTSKTYAVNNTVTNDGVKVYICTTAGASAASGGPTGTGTGITDGAAKWNYIGASASTATATATYNGINSLTVDALSISGTVNYPNSSSTLTLNVNNDITINTGASLLCGTQTNAVTHLLNVGGNITNNGTFTPVTTAGTKVVDVTLNGTSANQNLCAATFNNLTINNTASSNPGATLTGAVTVNNSLSFTAGKLSLGANSLTIASSGSILGANATNYIVTNGAGLLSQSVSANTSKIFPIGASTISYDPAIINPTTSIVYSASVGSTLSGAPTVSSYANSRQWNIVQAIGTPTATITLTPSTSSNTSNPVIGNYNGAVWTESVASLTGTSFTGTYALGSTNNFATGSRDAFFTTSRYWVGGASGNWDVASNWSYSSGGISGAPVPAVGTTTTGNNVYFDANSGGTVAVALPFTIGNSGLTSTPLNSINFDNSNVTFTISGASAAFTQATALTGVVSGSSTVELSSPNANIKVGQSVTLTGVLQANTTVSAISGTTLTLSKTASASAIGTLTFNTTGIVTNGMTLTNSAPTFNADVVTVISNLTFSGASSKIIHTPLAAKSFNLGNGGNFTLTGNDATKCFDGSTSAAFAFNTTDPLTVYFNPAIVFYQVLLTKGIVTLGTSLKIARLLQSTSNNNVGLTLNGNTLTISGAGSSTLTNTSAIGIDASASGSKVVISSSDATFLNATGRIFKDATTIDNLEMNSSTKTFISGYPLTVKNLILTAGKISTGSNTLTVAADGSVTGESSTSYIQGNLKKLIAAGSTSKTFEIGDATTYAPVTLALAGTIAGSTGSIQASTASSEHTQIATSAINAAKSVNRTWTITNPDALTGLTSYSPTFTFVAGDVDGSTNTNNFIVGKYASSAWTLPTVGTKTATTTQATGVSDFGDFAIGEANITTPTVTVTPIGTYTYNGSPQGPIAATNTGTGASYTFSYVGTGGTSYIASATLPTNAGTYTATATVAAHGSFSEASSSATGFSIEKVALTITANNQSVVYGTAISTVTGAGIYTPTGFVNSETASVISGLVTYSTIYTNTTVAATSGVTITPIVTSLTATNYSFTAVDGTITINPAQNTVIVPTLIPTILSALTTNISTDLIVPSTGVLTLNSPDASLNSVIIAAGGVLTVTSPVTVETVIFKAGKEAAGSSIAAVASAATFSTKIDAKITASHVYLHKTIDDLNWYFMSFPCDVTVSQIKKWDGSALVSLGTLGAGGDWFIKYYDGQNRAENGTGNNWKYIADAPDPTKLIANQGYIFGLKTVGATYSVELSIPLSTDVLLAETDGRTVTVSTHTGNAGGNHFGWNLVGQPYMSSFNGNGGKTTAPFMSFPDGNNATYSQVSNGQNYYMPPMSAYFVQVETNTAITFNKLGRQGAKSTVESDLSDRVQLNFASATGVDNTNLIMDNAQSTAYQIGQDLEKMIGTGTTKPQVYTILGGINYAFNALPMTSVVNLPLGIYTKTAGSTTISVDASQAPSLSKLLLTDYSTSPTTVTDLLTSNYTFTAAAGNNNSRFAITAQRITTDNNVIGSELGEVSISIVNGKLVLANVTNNTSVRVFDALGRMVISKTSNSNLMEIQLNARGIYTVQVQNGASITTRKVIY